ncbi:hypothetical protein FQR65_LT01333 [Abscondita terminalis]|nr:hypothetical protein FQR65_LT01333 [Abscondita terminalis]
MMSTILLPMLLVILLEPTSGLDCPWDYCKNNPCVTPKSCSEGEGYTSSYCLCCQICVPIVAKGGRCSFHLLGIPETSKCEVNSICVNGICLSSIALGNDYVGSHRSLDLMAKSYAITEEQD